MCLDDAQLRNVSQLNGPVDVGSALDELMAAMANPPASPFRPLHGAVPGRPSLREDQAVPQGRAITRLELCVESGCDKCLARAVLAAISEGVSRSNVKEALIRGVRVATRPALITAGEALAHFDALTPYGAAAGQGDRAGSSSRRGEERHLPDAAA